MAAAVVRYDKDSAIPLKVASGVTFAEGDLAGVDSSGNAILAVKTTGAIVKAIGVAVRAGVGNNGDYIAVAPIALVAGLSGKTPGATQYLSTAGGITETRPSTAGDSIQPVGIAISATKIQYNVTPSFVVAQAAATTVLA